MPTNPRHVLVVGADDTAVERIAPMLRRAEFEVHTVHASAFVLDLVLGTAFELLIASFPLEGELTIEELIGAVRHEGSNCLNAGVLLVAAPGSVDEAASWIDHGVNRVIGTEWADARVWQAVGDLLNVAPRVALRALVQIELGTGSGQDAELLRTENISISGMLLRGAESLAPGVRFDFTLGVPGEGVPIKGSAEVVRRHPQTEQDEPAVGVRFVSFSGDGRERLERYLGRRVPR
jgi:hypothetical protein